MRWFALSLVLGALVIVLASSSCDSSTGKACTSAHGTCLYPAGGALCATSAPSSAQDCSSVADQAGWVCCLVPAETELDAAPESGSTTPRLDASGDALADGASFMEAGEASSDDSGDDSSSADAGDASSDDASFTDAGDASTGGDAGTPAQDASDQ